MIVLCLQYTVAVLVIIILEVAAAVLAFVFRNDITDKLESNLQSAIEGYRVNRDAEDYEADTNNAVENIQDVFQCCGLEGSEDWFSLNSKAVTDNGGTPPGSCSCDLSDKKCQKFDRGYNAWGDGCIALLEENLRAVMLVIGVVGIVFAAIEVHYISNIHSSSFWT
jgi:hypothetical protein